MMQVSKLIAIKGAGSYYYEDVSALHQSPVPEEERWFAPGCSPGFVKIREPAEVVSVGIEVAGQVSWGDAVGVSYAGKSGRQGVFRHAGGLSELEEVVQPWISGRCFHGFRDSCRQLAEFNDKLPTPLHTATLFGLSQALLNAASGQNEFFRTIAREWGLPDVNLTAIPVQGSCGNQFYNGSDKMIAHRLAALPHAQVDDVEGQIGRDGSVFLERIRWLRQRIERFALEDYQPVIHFDVHGAFGKIFDNHVPGMAGLLIAAEKIIAPFQLRIESPLLGRDREEHLQLIGQLQHDLAQRGSRVMLAVDEWANTLSDIKYFADSGSVQMIHIKMPDLGLLSDVVEAVLYCRQKGVKTLLGGSCIETDISSRLGMHIAMVTRPDYVLARPGMGIDEGIMICGNEMARIAAMSRLS